MALSGPRAIAVGLVPIVDSCGADGSTASTSDVTTPEKSLATAVGSAPFAATSNASTTTSVVVTAPSLAATSVATTVPLAQSLDARAVSEALDSARSRWSDADVASYRLTVAEDRNFWNEVCIWNTVISGRVVTSSEVDPSSTSSECTPIGWTVDQLHEMISGWLDGVNELARPEFGEHTLVVGFNDIGVPVAMEIDVASGDDEESSMRVTFTPTA